MPTVRVAEPVPVPGVTVSQLPPPEVEGVAVNGTLALTVNATVCVCGAAVPMMYEKLSEVGKQLAARAKEAGITRVGFDRAGDKYHGRIKAVADGAREGGLEF